MIFIPPPPTSRQIGRKLGKLLATMRKLQTPVKPQPTTPQHTMSTTTQRPTPETDAAEINLGSACGQFSEWYVKPDFARKLERERDEAREQIEAMREAIKGAHRALTDVELRGREFEEGHCPYALASYLQSIADRALKKLQPFLKP